MADDVDHDSKRYSGTPLLVVEVLSTNVTDDTIRQMRDYARAGLPEYRILSPHERTLWAYRRQGDL